MSHIERRKREHIEMALQDGAESGRTTLFEDVYLPPVSVPSHPLGSVDVSTRFLGRTLPTPLLISGMTGGHEAAMRINRNLALAAAEVGAAIGIGSQRAAFENPELEATYSIVREAAPDGYVLGNIGMSQLVPQEAGPAFVKHDIERAVEMVRADALAIHLNAIEELVQPEGDREMAGLLDAIAQVVEWSPVPVVAKETGCGMTRETAMALAGAGVAALDVGGVGGTSFARIEGMRARAVGDERGTRLGETFGAWGVPTALSVIEARTSGLPLAASGGIRNGLQAAKAVALGATLVGIGGPIMRAARKSSEAAAAELRHVIEELKVAMVLSGVGDLGALQDLDVVLLGRVAEWVSARHLDEGRRGVPARRRRKEEM